jgi:NitT/TauT family transport system ATP-binding protein
VNGKIAGHVGEAETARADGAREPVPSRPAGAGVAVAAENISKRYGPDEHALLALERIDLRIANGEIVALLGPSGCGKSTLLKVLGGLYPMTGGRVEIHGQPVDGPSTLVGFMFQTPVLFPWLTVLENALLPVRVRHESLRQHEPRARGHIETVGLTGFEDRHPWELSGGMQQRAAICRMLMTDPEVLLLDEPFGALDELTREYMDEEMRSIVNATGKTAIFVTHSVPEAVFVADRVVVLSPRPGRIAGEVRVDIGRERRSELFSSEELLAGVRQVRAILESGADGRSRP